MYYLQLLLLLLFTHRNQYTLCWRMMGRTRPLQRRLFQEIKMLPKYNPVDDVPATTQALPPVGENTTSSAQPEPMYVHTQFKSRN